MNAVTRIDDQAMAPVADQGAALIAVIARAAADPNTNVENMERLLAMHSTMAAQTAELAFNAAMREAQSKTSRVAADARNDQTRSNYATYGKLDKVLRPIYTGCGFSLSFDTAESPKPDCMRVLCYVSHEAGHTRTYRADIPADGKGAKGGDVMTKTHAFGAGSSYGMRYLLKMIFNIAIGEEDTDGNDPEPEKLIDAKQLSTLRDWIVNTASDEAKFCEAMRCETLEELPAKKFSAALSALKKKADTLAGAK